MGHKDLSRAFFKLTHYPLLMGLGPARPEWSSRSHFAPFPPCHAAAMDLEYPLPAVRDSAAGGMVRRRRAMRDRAGLGRTGEPAVRPRGTPGGAAASARTRHSRSRRGAPCKPARRAARSPRREPPDSHQVSSGFVEDSSADFKALSVGCAGIRAFRSRRAAPKRTGVVGGGARRVELNGTSLKNPGG